VSQLSQESQHFDFLHFSFKRAKKPFFSQQQSPHESQQGAQVVQQEVHGAQEVFGQQQSSQHFFLPSQNR
jgi:hypothetical protein